jgi:raffinose/stachyose/melibiose transport system permease protein
MEKRGVFITKNLVLIFILIFMLYPIYMVVVNSFKSNGELYSNILGLPRKPVLSNYVDAVVLGRLGRALINSIIITAGSVILVTILGSFSAFAITRKRSKIYNFIYALFIAGIIIPYQVGLFQLYRIVDSLRMVNTYHGIIIVFVAWQLSFTVFVMYGFFKTVPLEIEEAAIIDGCSLYRLYGMIIIPLSTSVITATVIFNLVEIWNDMLFPMIFIDDQFLKPMSTALLTFKGKFVSRYATMFAGVVIVSLPLVVSYLLLQKQFIAGMMAGSIKG